MVRQYVLCVHTGDTECTMQYPQIPYRFEKHVMLQLDFCHLRFHIPHELVVLSEINRQIIGSPHRMPEAGSGDENEVVHELPWNISDGRRILILESTEHRKNHLIKILAIAGGTMDLHPTYLAQEPVRFTRIVNNLRENRFDCLIR